MKKKLSATIKKIIDERTIKVSVLSYKKHPKYLKRYRVTKNYLVHSDPESKKEIGESVLIEETKPISKNKHWRIV